MLSDRPTVDAIDELAICPSPVRKRYEALLEVVRERGASRVRDSFQARMGREGVCFRNEHGRKPFRVDPVPRMIAEEEWAAVERGLSQRAAALEEFIRDAYSEQRIVAAGLVPERVVTGSRLYDPRLRGVEVPRGAYVFVYGPDLIRDAEGQLVVLEDNLRTPSGISYLLAIRDALGEELGEELQGVRPLDPDLRALSSALRLAAPDGASHSSVAVLTDGSGSPAFYEHCEAARRMGAPLITLDELETAGDEVFRRDDHGRRVRVDVIYRRTDEAALSDPDGGLTPVGEKLGASVVAGTIGVANAFGAGVADDKLAHAYSETMIRFYLDEDPLLSSVRTLDLGDEAQREEALARADELVFKVRDRAGGLGVVVEPAAGDGPGLDRIRAAVAERPDDYVAQERATLSTLPTVDENDSFGARRVDLRPFVFRTNAGWEAIAGGLTRFAPSADSLVVNSTQGGGGKDTWILS